MKIRMYSDMIEYGQPFSFERVTLLKSRIVLLAIATIALVGALLLAG